MNRGPDVSPCILSKFMTHQEARVAPVAGLPAESVVAAAEEAPVGVGAGPVRAAGGVALTLVDVDL